jgi:hypothetical protein
MAHIPGNNQIDALRSQLQLKGTGSGGGATGATGPAGSPGGATGATGSAGATGATGASGATGATGAGATGATGATGVGATGATGANGATGATGAIGATGATGAGATGATGSAGATGAAATTTTASFVQPLVGSPVTVTVTSTAAVNAPGGFMSVSDGGAPNFYGIVSITDATHIVVVNLGGPNEISGTVIGSGAPVTSSGPYANWNGDLISSSTFEQWVSSISGSSGLGGTVGINANDFQIQQSQAFSWTQQQAAVGVDANRMAWRTQQPDPSSTGAAAASGGFFFDVGTSVDSVNYPTFGFGIDGVIAASINAHGNNSGFTDFYLGKGGFSGGAPNGSAYLFVSDGASLLAFNSPTLSTPIQIRFGGSTTFAQWFDLGIGIGTTINVNAFGGANNAFAFSTSALDPSNSPGVGGAQSLLYSSPTLNAFIHRGAFDTYGLAAFGPPSIPVGSTQRLISSPIDDIVTTTATTPTPFPNFTFTPANGSSGVIKYTLLGRARGGANIFAEEGQLVYQCSGGTVTFTTPITGGNRVYSTSVTALITTTVTATTVTLNVTSPDATLDDWEIYTRVSQV